MQFLHPHNSFLLYSTSVIQIPAITVQIMEDIFHTMCINVPKFIMQIEQTSQTVSVSGYRPVSCQDILVELKMWR